MLIITGVMFVTMIIAFIAIYLERGRYVFESSNQAKEINVGQARDFYVYDFAQNRQIKVAARCVRIGKYSVICVEPKLMVPGDILDRIRAEFDESIYQTGIGKPPTDKFLNMYPTSKVVILLLAAKHGRIQETGVKEVAGYYSKLNEQARLYNTESNQAKIIHVFIEPRNINGDTVMETVAHEARHLKDWSATRDNVGLVIGSLFAFATVVTMYLGLSHLYFRSFR